jgi:hypothetical protein
MWCKSLNLLKLIKIMLVFNGNHFIIAFPILLSLGEE